MWKFIVLTLAYLVSTTNTQASDNAVILVYHHVSEDTPNSTSVSPRIFEQHMQYLADNHTVLPLKTVIEKLQNQQALPDKTVVITFDDGYQNIHQNAHPILQKFGFHYTIFINPALIDTLNSQLTWQQVKQLQKQNVSFANHGNAHLHSLQKQTNESKQDWLSRVTKNVTEAEQLLTEKLGYSLKYFAYPYGEFNQAFKQQLTQLGYVSFAQHSGAIASHSDFSALPRFPAAGIYSNINTLKVKLNSLAMPVSKVLPQEPELASSIKQVDLTFQINSDDINPSQVACFKSGDKIPHKLSDGLMSIKVDIKAKPGRHKVNCTVPSKQLKGRYYWLSHPFFVPTNQGKWLD
ncbi:polysaccharide deacetylase family protein [Paraglaciecola aquimarina]|uniref:Polysaccharide deacetylase family protein n=1 Tax=Paraglaciecola algarum TaxID=3050085 RepID=A0ABS9DBT0_9ALTE|nr:polysaccharide deacetylase family protein [Paraglaciecola sp. G1-23]MCF2950290.1 polysaccharide deacetylase family protein [Paraglaciecola sp. G1-23]